MIWRIAKKEFSLNLLSRKFAIALVLCLLLIPVTIIVSLDNYNSLVRTYQIDKERADKELKAARVYSAVKPILVFPPQPLSIFCQGVSNQMGHSVKIRLGEKTLLGEGSVNGRDNPLLMSFFSIDFIHVLAILISLLGLIFSFDLFSGEKENGTFKLLLSNPVKRSTVIIGKIVGVFLSLAPILILCYILSILILFFSPKVHFSIADWLGILTIFVASFFFMAFFVALGLLVSLKSRSSFNGIVVSLFLWLWFLFVWPNISVYASQSLVRTEMLDQLQQALRNCEKDMLTKKEEITKNLHFYNVCWNCNDGEDEYREVAGSLRRTMEEQRRFKEQYEPIRLAYADKKWQLQRAYLDNLNKQERTARYISFFSPSEIFSHLGSMLCGTSAISQQILYERARNYRETLVNYFVQNKIFASYKYFTPQAESTFLNTWDEQINIASCGECKNGKEFEEWKRKHGGSIDIIYRCPYNDGILENYPPLNISALPIFNQYSLSITSSFPLILMETTVILTLFLILLAMVYKASILYDVR